VGMQGDALQRRIDSKIEADLHSWQPEEHYRFRHLSKDLFSLLNEGDAATPDIMETVYAYSVIARWLSLVSIRRPILLAVENLITTLQRISHALAKKDQKR
jgi:hypothetical protein